MWKRKIWNLFALVLCALLAFGSVMGVRAEEGEAAEQNSVSEPVAHKIYVNRAANCVTVVTVDGQGTETPVRAMACSCGRAGHETPTGTFATTGYYEWCLMVDDSYGRYAVRFNGSILLHSVPYLAKSPDTLEWDQYNLLGEPASLGCVRLCLRDIKWIYDNCSRGTVVVVYDDAENPGPLGKPETTDIDGNSPYRGWDPTDLDARNPWHAALLNGLTYDNFDAVGYAERYPDIKAAFGLNRELLWKHYVECGRQEGRTATALETVVTYDNFDAVGYAERYPDVKAAFGLNRELLWKHYVECGKQEGRTASVLPSGATYANFDAERYAAYYPDVMAAFGLNKDLLWKHYSEYGRREGRKFFVKH